MIKSFPKLLTIQDISCVGQCSMTVALPILSACGVETCALPTAVLSNHTAFSDFTCHDLTDELPVISRCWKNQDEEFLFDAFYTGYLGSEKLIHITADIIKAHSKSHSLFFFDPAMADNGKLYPAFDMQYAEAMKTLCSSADAILPNLTEACLLTDTPYPETYNQNFISKLVDKLHTAGVQIVILTGISYAPGYTGVVVSDRGNMQYYQHKKLPHGSHGTGDVYASAFIGACLHGKNIYQACKIAANFVVACLENTIDDPSHWYGVRFEPMIPSLIRAIEE